MPLHVGEILATEDRLARLLSWVTAFPLPHDSLGVGERSFSQVVTQVHQLTGANPSILNRHRWGLQP
jgi:hypothetical protein